VRKYREMILEVLRFRGDINRGQFLIAGLVLFGVKYTLDRAISILFFGRPWFITEYFIRLRSFDVTGLSEQDTVFYATMAALSLPFIFVGTLLCVKRLRNAGLSPWFTTFFFIPMLNFFLFLILSIVPARDVMARISEPSFLSRLLPRSRIGSVAVAIGVTVFTGLLAIVFSTNILEEYGWGVFVGTPFFVAFASVLLHGYHQPRTRTESLSVAFLSTGVLALCLLALAIEGVLCVAMVMPLALTLSLLGGLLGHVVQKRGIRPSLGLLSVALVIPLSSLYESMNPLPSRTLYVRTVVEIAAEPETVWDNLIHFETIPAPTELLFRAGISYPVHAEIHGTGDQSIRHCVFNTGVFVEPIEVWDAPHRLSFSVQSQPEPITELSPYRSINPPHLHGYFVSSRGEFRLQEIPTGGTLLEGSTWYTINLWPNPYWKLWTDYIIHRIHFRVLNHIKKQSEAP
jgi:uncharacterized membrane protein YhaH (DUF805 family)